MVICDTNIFYDLDQGAIAKAWFHGEQVAGTMLSQLEFSKTYKLIYNLEQVKGAARAMNNHCTNIIDLSPPDYVLKKIIPNYQPNPIWFWAVRESFQTLLNPNFDLPQHIKDKARYTIDDYEKPFKDIILKENKRLAQRPKYNKIILEGIKLADFTSVSKKEIKEQVIAHYSIAYPGSAIEIDDNADGWEDLQFFINVYTDYHKIFIERRDRKLRNNDFIDLCMTVYVGKNDLFWTNENFWIDLIKANPKTAPHLHPLCGKKR